MKQLLSNSGQNPERAKGFACKILTVAQLCQAGIIALPLYAPLRYAQPVSAQPAHAQPAQVQATKAKSPAEIISSAYSLILNRKATPQEQQYWNVRLGKFSPFAVTDLYDGLTRLPEFRKRFAGLSQKDQIALMYKTLLNRPSVDPESEKKWLSYLKTHTLSDTIETIVSSPDHIMFVYVSAGLSNQREWDAVHIAEDMAAKNPRKATEMYRNIIKGTKIPEVYFFLARVQSGYDLKAAIETLQGAVARFPDDALAELKLSYLTHSIGAMGVSISRATHAIRVSDERAGADSLISNMRERLDKAKHPECLSREMLLTRASAHDRADQHIFALPELERALAIGAGDGTVYTQLTNVYFNIGQYAKAVEYGVKAEKVSGVSFSILWPRSLSYYALGKYKEAIADFDKVIPLGPLPRFYETRAKSYEKLGRYKEAIPDYNILIKGDPKAIKNYVGRGRNYLALGKTKEAFADANRALKIGPRFREAYRFRAECYRKMGNKSAADADQKKYEQMTKLYEEPKDFE